MSLEIVSPISITTGSFSRASTAKYVDASGILQTAAVDAFRVNHVYKSGTATFVPDLPLFESTASTNLLIYSEDYSNAAWTKNNVIVSANALAAPDSATTADTLSSTSVLANITQSITKTAIAAKHTLSAYVKAGTSSTVTLEMSNAGTYATATFNLTASTSTVSNSGWGTVTASISRLANSWYRVSITSVSNAGTGITAKIVIPNNSNTLHLWGTQLETNSLSSYVPTAASTATRAADVLTGVYASNVPENDYAEWNSATAYSTLGTRVILASTHKVYENINVTGNTNKSPSTSPTFWLEVGATNKWKMFDQIVSTATTNTSNISFVLKPGSVINSLSLLEISGSVVNLKMYSGTDGLVYEKSINVSGELPSVSWYDYFFATVIPDSQAIFNDLPPYGNAEIHVTIYGPAPEIGLCLVGYKTLVGYSIEYGTSIGVQDYSRRERNDYGEIIFVKRAFSKRVSYKLKIPDRSIDSVQRLFTTIRSTPVLWVGSEHYESTVVYGFYKDFDMVLSNPIASDRTLEVEGLI